MVAFVQPTLSPLAADIYEPIETLPIVSPHGHCDPSWWAENGAFPDPAELLIIPDHYVFRMLYSHGVKLEDLGIGQPAEHRDPRAIFQLFADYWDTFLGTPSRSWMEYTLYKTIGVETELSAATADAVYDEISTRLNAPEFRPRALFDRFGIEVLATTDTATDSLIHHSAIGESGWSGRVIPTFRPDDVLNPARPGHAAAIVKLAEQTGEDIGTFASFLSALRKRRAAFRALGATATDHDVPVLATNWLPSDEIEALHGQAVLGALSDADATRYYGHMLIEMAQMSVDDGMVMQIHAGNRRNTNRQVFETFGPDMGSDIPVSIDWVRGMESLLNRVGNDPNLRVLLFTLDESTYARELAPMVGHWPCLRLGPPWWFHDSLNGMLRYFDQVVESAGYFNLAGFNDDTRAFLSIPARHDTWRRAVAMHLAFQVDRGVMARADAMRLGPALTRDMALDSYRISSVGA